LTDSWDLRVSKSALLPEGKKKTAFRLAVPLRPPLHATTTLHPLPAHEAKGALAAIPTNTRPCPNSLLLLHHHRKTGTPRVWALEIGTPAHLYHQR
jgi:hypothetical protein